MLSDLSVVNTDGLGYGMAVRITTNGTQKLQYGRIYVEEAGEIVLTIRSFIKDAKGDGIEKAGMFLAGLPESYEILFPAMFLCTGKVSKREAGTWQLGKCG